MYGEINLYLAETGNHIKLHVQELVAHPTELYSRCPHALFIIGVLLAYIVSILQYRGCLCEGTEAVCEKKEAWKEIEKNKERGNQPDSRIYTHTGS